MRVTWRMLLALVVFFPLACLLTVLSLSLTPLLQGAFVLDYPLSAVLASFGPAVAAVVAALLFRYDLRSFGWGSGRLGFYVFALGFPFFLVLLWHGALWLAGFFVAGTAGLPHGIIAPLAISLAAMVLLAIGEEIGWRGFLVPHLADMTGSFALTGALSGVLWALWHFPFLSTRPAVAGPAWVVYLDFTIGIVGVSYVYCWLRLASGSLWPCVVLHAVMNWLVSYASPLWLTRVVPADPGSLAILLLVDTLVPAGMAALFLKFSGMQHDLARKRTRHRPLKQ